MSEGLVQRRRKVPSSDANLEVFCLLFLKYIYNFSALKILQMKF